MGKRKAGKRLSQHTKRRKTEVPTINELRYLLEPYDGSERADVVLKDEANRVTLRRWYDSLSSDFRRGRKRNALNSEAIQNIRSPQIRIAAPILSQFDRWYQDPRSFWWPTRGQPALEEGSAGAPNRYGRRFIEDAIENYKRIAIYKVLWRFTTVAAYLAFRRSRPSPPRYITNVQINEFLTFMGCEVTEETTAMVWSIVKAGQRRITFSDLLAGTAEKECVGEAADEAAYLRQKSALGVFFLDVLPDSIWDEEDGLRSEDLHNAIKHLRSIGILTLLAEKNTERVADALLNFQQLLLWPDEDALRPMSRGSIYPGTSTSCISRQPAPSSTATLLRESQTSEATAAGVAPGVIHLLAAAQVTGIAGNSRKVSSTQEQHDNLSVRAHPPHAISNIRSINVNSHSFTAPGCFNGSNTVLNTTDANFSVNIASTEGDHCSRYYVQPESFGDAVPADNSNGIYVQPESFGDAVPADNSAGFYVQPEAFGDAVPADNSNGFYVHPEAFGDAVPADNSNGFYVQPEAFGDGVPPDNPAVFFTRSQSFGDNIPTDNSNGHYVEPFAAAVHIDATPFV
ncbi:uncharacterized protein BBA_10151 [Beauveria bassiana ARSEF 2860]|uniref:Uncharacterized protein n=1 Tax=Beauveria bassiana (strain ARSEF 2860) TaxID=655819 RepID=J5J213_BEAB2|nr:uncharacterized protein BBA_10151 [Beauveria bassiana ARSEF 2860]EJP60908.1 hypothetical protein BBA_10151 [Beauveria bassiana ARSEF 2860]